MPRKVNPFLLMPDLRDVGDYRAMMQKGQDALDTLDQINPDTLYEDRELDGDLRDALGLED